MSAEAQTIYVDTAATGAEDGSSWSNAYKYLQDALSIGIGLTIIDDFELYDDVYPYLPWSNAIFLTWLDGFTNNTGSIIGYLEPPFCEKTIVLRGNQAMPFFYDNDGTVQYIWQGTQYTEDGRYCYSETQRTFETLQDWSTTEGRPLSLWFCGGYPASVGSFNYTGTDPCGPYNATMTGSGTDIWDVPDDPGGGYPYHDEFHYAFKRLYSASGAVTITAKVESVQNTHPWAKAGVMIREKLSGNSTHAFVCVTPGNGVSFHRRPLTAGASEHTTKVGIGAPHWVRLYRSSDGWFSASHSTDGVTWYDIGNPSSVQISMSTNVFVGLAVTSHDTDVACQAVFSNIQIYIPDEGYILPGWGNRDIGINSNDPEQMYLAVEDTNGNSSVSLHDDPNAVLSDEWQEWKINVNNFKKDGVQLNSIKKLAIGFGHRYEPTIPGGGTPGGSGLVFIDDIEISGGWGDGGDIYMAQGIYKPDEDSINPNGSGDRTATFNLMNGLRIYGGFPSGGATWEQRNPSVYETVLSGDLNGDDQPGFINNGDNSYHVVTGSDTEPNTILDGFIITAGYASESYPHDTGGGMYNSNGSPTVSNCIFIGNKATYGGGMGNRSSSSPKVINCTFRGNEAGTNGGGMYNRDSNPTAVNCIFSSNTALYYGGGMYNRDSRPTVTNCNFINNTALNYGGGLYNHESHPTVTNCILWGDTPDEIYNYSWSSPIVSYSDVQGGWTGAGNISDDPMFKDADGPDDIFGTEDDNLRLSGSSPCIDSGDYLALPADVTTDLGGAPRIAGWIVDMGSYEWDSPGAHWKLDETGDYTAYDSAGNNHGTLQGGPVWQPTGGKTGGALQLDGVDDFVDCNNDSSFNITEEITLSAWVNITTVPADWTTIVSKGDSAYRLSTNLNENKFHLGVCGPPWVNMISGNIEVPTGEWHHVAGTYDRQFMRLYVDGVIDAQQAATEAIPTNTYNVYIGENSESRDRYWHGLIDDVRIYNYALSAGEIRWLLCDRPPRGDVNRDCRFDFVDLAILLSEWLDCGMMVPELCGQ